MDEKSLEMLEFPRIIDILCGLTTFSASRELAAAVKPLDDYEEISRLLKQAGEAARLLRTDSGFSLGEVADIRPAAKMAAKGGLLERKDILEIAATLNSLNAFRLRLAEVSADYPVLWDIARDIVPLPQITRSIARCLDAEGDVLDTASPVLAGIRQELRGKKNQLLERLNAIMTSPGMVKLLQEEIITQRDDRFVIPVKIESRHAVRGIIHDISNTGSTAFIEPEATIGLGNDIRELTIAERNEITRILMALSAEIGEQEPAISRNIAIAAQFDLILAKGRYALKADAAEPELAADGTGLRLVKARHPLLREKAVPLDIELGKDFSILVLTGPNTGGKTVALKTVGLLALMTQAGIPIPASPESSLPVFDGIFSDIGDEQSIEQTLSTFSWHISNIVRIVGRASKHSLVLLDELGTSTDPAQGSALARAIINRLLSIGALGIATTHFAELKVFAHATPGLQNGSLDFDPVTLRPTYHLSIGFPGESGALATALRLGLPPQIVEEARSLLSPASLELESLLADIRKERQTLQGLNRELEKEREDLNRTSAATRAELERQNAKLQAEISKFNAEKNRLIQEARDRLVSETGELYKEIREAIADLRREKSRGNVEKAERVLARTRKTLNSELFARERPEETDRICPGDIVWLEDSRSQAQVLSVSEKTGKVEVLAGQVKITLGLDRVTKIPSGKEKLPEATRIMRPLKEDVPGELDLRGKRAYEVEPLIDEYLNDASMANLHQVRIIHGHGTGTVRELTRDFIAMHPLVKSYRPGGKGEGSDGVLVVTLWHTG